MVTLMPNANERVNSLIYEKSTISYWHSVCERYTKGYVNCFITDMQVLITKLGIIVSAVSNGRSISYCSQSIDFLCDTVLDSPVLKSRFDSIGINQKGNEGKHRIEHNVSIDMDKCVVLYNTVVNRIIDIYGLTSLKAMIVRKKDLSADQATVRSSQRQYSREVHPAQAQRPAVVRRPAPRPQQSGKPLESAALVDENIKLKATLEKGAGRYLKGIINKKQMVNFKLSINIENKEGLRISSVTAYLKGKKNAIQKKLSCDLVSVTEFDLPVEEFGGNVEASVVVEYKLGIFKSKTIKVTVSKNF